MFGTPPGLSTHATRRAQLIKYHAVIKLLREGTLDESMQALKTVRDSVDVEHAVDSVLESCPEQKARTLADLFALLQGESEDAALETFRSLRQGQSPEATLRSIGGDMCGRVTPSLHTTNRSLLPPTQTPLEFQLVVEHANVYPSLVPLDPASLDLWLLGIEPLGVKTGLQSDIHGPGGNPVPTVNPQTIMYKNTDSRARGLVDARLAHVNIRRWTNIHISNQLAAEAISLYLRVNQPWWSFFDTDLFINDLVSGQTDFCSQLLVNAVLAWATVSSPNNNTR